MQVRLLGPVDVTVDGVPRPVPGLRRKAVLAALAIGRGEVVSIDRLMDVVWGADPPATALNTLQRHISYLRQVLGSKDAIVARPPGYLLAVDDDASLAERLVRQGIRATDRAERMRHLQAALELWRGRPLADVVGLAGLDAEAERLEDLWLQARKALTDDRLELGEHAQVVPLLERMTREHPLDEQVHGQLMLAQYRAGRTADALATYQRLRHALDEELGLDPGPGVRALESAILRQDPALDPALDPAGPSRKGPAQLPLAVRGFTGHAEVLAGLDALLDADSVVIGTVSGPPGVGKTSLAVHWAHTVAARFPDGQLYVNLRGFDPRGSVMDPAEALRGFLDALAVPAEQVPADLDARSTALRSELAGKRVLMILDNARDAEQVRPLLPGAPGCLVLVTSRNQLTPLVAAEGAHPFGLDLLSAEEARELLTRRIGADRVDAEPGAVAEIITRCARLPLALAVAAAHVTTRPGAPLAEQAAQLRATAGGLDALDGGDPATDVRAVFSWSYRALEPGTARLFRLLGLHPGPDLAAPGAASLAGRPAGAVEPLLRQLVEANLLTEPTPGRYGLHDLLRSYATEQAHGAEPAVDRRDAVHRVLEHYLHTAHAAVLLLDPGREGLAPALRPDVTIGRPADRDEALAWFGAEHAVLLAAVDLAAAEGFDHHVWRLAWTLTTHFDWQGRWDELIATQTAALAALERLDEGPGRANAHRDIGRTFARLGRYDEATDHLDRALDLYGRLGDLVGQARTHHNIGWMRHVRQDYAGALTHSERAYALFLAAGDLLWQARTLNGSGWLHAQLGDHAKSLIMCQRALALMQELGDRHGEAGTWDSVAFAHHQLGDHREAARCYERSIALFEDLGDLSTAAEVRLHLGDTLQSAGRPAAARTSWQQALDAFETLGHPAATEARTRLQDLPL